MEQGAAGTRQYVLFRLGEEEYGLPIEQVNSIIRYEEATPVPRAPEIVDGVVNLRGKVIPVVNLARKFGAREFVAGSTSRIVVAEGEGGLVGLVVDAASEVARISPEDVRDAPEAALSVDTEDAFEGVATHEGKLVVLLKLDKVLPKAEYATTAPEEAEQDA